MESANRGVLVVGGGWVEADDMDVPSWKGRRGRLATAKECRRKTLDAISVGRERVLLVMAGVSFFFLESAIFSCP